MAWADGRVETRSGPVQGVRDALDTRVWRGIPFAQPPTGPLRWKAPRPALPWSEPLDASRFAKLAPQALPPDARGRASEDCLYLNVWRPDTSETGLPVYVWVHGGGNVVAMPTVEQTPGCAIAARSNVVVVSVQYRLGELGWFAHPALRSGRPEDALDDSGNYGTLDIIAALRWVQENIEAFGGDPARVLVTGESAGAYNVLSLLISPAARGLFHAGLAQSGRQDTYTMERADQRGQAVLRYLRVEDGSAASPEEADAQIEKLSPEEIAAYLRAKSFADLLRTRRHVPFLAGYRDGAVLHRDGFQALHAGTYCSRVPMIIGMNREEAKLQLSMARAWQRMDADVYAAVARYLSDLKKASGADDLLRALASHPDQPPVYSYLMCWGAHDAAGRSAAPEPFATRTGACHGIDIPFFFGDMEEERTDFGTAFTLENRAGRVELCDAVLRYAGSFAHRHDPNPPGSDLPVWQPWSNAPDGVKALSLDADAEHARIAMNREELTEAGVRKSLDALPERLRDAVRAHIR